MSVHSNRCFSLSLTRLWYCEISAHGAVVNPKFQHLVPCHSVCEISMRGLCRSTVGFTRAAGLVKELSPQEQLQARVAADFERR